MTSSTTDKGGSLKTKYFTRGSGNFYDVATKILRSPQAINNDRSLSKPNKQRKFECHVLSYARIRPVDEFAFALFLDLRLRLRKTSGKDIFGSLRVKLLVVEICKNTVLF